LSETPGRKKDSKELTKATERVKRRSPRLTKTAKAGAKKEVEKTGAGKKKIVKECGGK
jgi:hypothetical protein